MSTYVVTMGRPATLVGQASPSGKEAMTVLAFGAPIALVAHFAFGLGWLAAAALGLAVPAAAILVASQASRSLGS